MPLALLALAVGAFGIGTTEFVMMGLLPDVADDLGISVPTAGYLVSAYALGVVIGAPLLTAVGARVPRKRMLLAADGPVRRRQPRLRARPRLRHWLLAGRFLAGLPHGAFFGVGAVVAARLVARRSAQARAVVAMFLGLTVANIVGVPAATLLGQHLGWRATFLVVTRDRPGRPWPRSPCSSRTCRADAPRGPAPRTARPAAAARCCSACSPRSSASPASSPSTATSPR